MAALVLLVALAVTSPDRTCSPQFAPLDTGTYSGASDVPFWTKEAARGWGGEGWLGWTYDSDIVHPVRFMIRSRPKDDPRDDDEVTVVTTPEVTYAVRCIQGIRAGRIRNAGVANHELQFNGPLSISLGRRRYRLSLDTANDDLTTAKVVLRDGQRTQVLYSADGFVDDPHFIIEWAGDLDRDGKLDLIVNLSRKYAGHPHRLLLSSRASRTELVAEVARFTTAD
jgi:hypothetical protein